MRVDEHLSFLADRLGVSKDELCNFLPSGDARAFLTLIATKGGVSEAVAHMLRATPHIAPAELFSLISHR